MNDIELFKNVLKEIVNDDFQDLCSLGKEERVDIVDITNIYYYSAKRWLDIPDYLFSFDKNFHFIDSRSDYFDTNNHIIISWLEGGITEYILSIYDDGEIVLEKYGFWSLIINKNEATIAFYDSGFEKDYEESFKTDSREYGLVECVIDTIICCHKMIYIDK